MPIETNYIQYHQSISRELTTLKDRIRNLIGPRHWQTDGEHKETILRKILANHVADSLRIGRGFICYPNGGSSKQLDILLTNRNKPTLFKDGELTLVTPDAVSAIIEVKTKQNITQLRATLGQLAEQAEQLRKYQENCPVGLFVFETNKSLDDNKVLSLVHSVSNNKKTRVINWIALGPHSFFRFWPRGSDIGIGEYVQYNLWHSYHLKDLAHAYFISNAVWETSSDSDSKMQFAWFPIKGGKEPYKTSSIRMNPWGP